MSLDEYGPCVTEYGEEELVQATDNYSIAALKVSHNSKLYGCELSKKNS